MLKRYLLMAAVALVATILFGQMPKPTGGGGAASPLCAPDTYANISASSSASLGKTCRTTDSPYTLIGNGSTFDVFHSKVIGAVIPPPTAGWTDVNYTGATTVTTGNVMTIEAPASAGRSLRIRRRAATPTSIEACFSVVVVEVNFSEFGIGYTDGTKVVGLRYTLDTAGLLGWGVNSTKYTNSTTISANYTALATGRPSGGDVCFRQTNSSGNFTFYYSFTGGAQWTQVGSPVSTTDFLGTMTGIVVFASPFNSNAGTMTVYHWKEI
jgi:hypothetical protein